MNRSQTIYIQKLCSPRHSAIPTSTLCIKHGTTTSKTRGIFCRSRRKQRVSSTRKRTTHQIRVGRRRCATHQDTHPLRLPSTRPRRRAASVPRGRVEHWLGSPVSHHPQPRVGDQRLGHPVSAPTAQPLAQNDDRPPRLDRRDAPASERAYRDMPTVPGQGGIQVCAAPTARGAGGKGDMCIWENHPGAWHAAAILGAAILGARGRGGPGDRVPDGVYQWSTPARRGRFLDLFKGRRWLAWRDHGRSNGQSASVSRRDYGYEGLHYQDCDEKWEECRRGSPD